MNPLEMRYELLKKLYFRSTQNMIDDDGAEMPQLIERKQIVQMFENMGVELPLTPSDPIKFVRR